MTDHYEDTDDTRDRVLKNRQVLGFISRFWLRRPGLLAATIALTLAAIAFDLALPSSRLNNGAAHSMRPMLAALMGSTCGR